MRAPIGLLPVLMADGCTTRWLMERTGESREECVRLLSSLGAKRNGARWTMPSLARSAARERKLTQGPMGSGMPFGYTCDGGIPRRHVLLGGNRNKAKE